MKTLLKPDVKTVYLNNKGSERVEFLELSPEIDRRSLEEDIKKGAVHFKETAAFVDKKKKSRLVVVSAENKEAGLMAISYMASCINYGVGATALWDCEEYLEKEKNPFQEEDSFGFFEEYSSKWRESGNKIPLIDAGEIKRYLYRNQESFDMGMYRVQQMNAMNNEKPYWTECKQEAVCILCDKFQADELNAAALELFRSNRIVFLLYLERYEDGFASRNYPFEMEASVFDKIKNNIILMYAADEVGVFLSEVDRKKYYTHVLKQNMKTRNIKAAKDFSYVRLINLAVSMRKDAVCATLDLIVNYALKDVEKTAGLVLKNKDFDFADRFLRVNRQMESEKASARLEKELVGLEKVKEQVLDTVNVMKYNRLRENLNITGGRYHNVHVMLGAPGTAKTTVAKLMGQLMVEEKLLPDDRFICVNGAELKGQYVGQSAPKTKALFDNYDVIIIDEAYSLAEGNGALDSFSNEAIAQLIMELEKHSTDKLVIFAGYGGRDVAKKDNRMQAFLEANPGIKSRITSTFYFESYKPREMVEIFRRIAGLANYKVEAAAEESIVRYFEDRVQDGDFGNGREARNLLETSIVFAAKRIMADRREKYTAEELKQLKTEDIRQAIARLSDAFGIRKAGEITQIGFAGGGTNGCYS